MNTKFITNRSNNNIDNEVDTDMLSILNIAIKNINVKYIIGRTNNNQDMKVDISIFIGKTIGKTNVQLFMNRLHRTNAIVEKKIYKSNLFWLLLTLNKSLISKIIP